MVSTLVGPGGFRPPAKLQPNWIRRRVSRPTEPRPARALTTALDVEVPAEVTAEAARYPSEESFDQVVARYYPKVYNICYRYMMNSEEAEDLTQDTFLRAHQSFANFRGDSAVFTWLYRIALNLCHNRTKQLKRRKRMEQESLDDPVGDEGEEQQKEIPDLSMSPERVAETKELQRMLKRSIHALPPDYKAVILLREFENLSYEEIAEVLGCSLEAVKSRLFRARVCLKEKLAPYLYGEQWKRRDPRSQAERTSVGAAEPGRRSHRQPKGS